MPDPPDYGGVIDVRYKIEALHQAGARIHLHCFEYGRGRRPELDAYCEEVHYYRRVTSRALLLQRLPFIAVSRKSPELLQRLLADEYPILFEGLHTCYHIGHPALAARTKLVRTHNVEHTYYEALSEAEPSAFRRAYLKREATKLKKFEEVLQHSQAILAISPDDRAHFSGLYGKTEYVPAFHHAGTGTFTARRERVAMYHGNLAVAENHRAAMFLVERVAPLTPHPLVIAGSKPLPELRRAVAACPHAELLDNLSASALQAKVSAAAVNVIPTFQATGIKLKLLYALYCGAHCVVNPPMVQGNGLGDFCTVADTPEAMAEAINECMDTPYTEAAHDLRMRELEQTFSNLSNAKRILALLSA